MILKMVTRFNSINQNYLHNNIEWLSLTRVPRQITFDMLDTEIILALTIVMFCKRVKTKIKQMKK